jgi:hypothetical protein
MSSITVISTKVFNKLKFHDFLNIQGVGLKTAIFFNHLKKKQIINNQQLKTIIQSYNKETNNKIRYNFITKDLILTKDGLIYKLIYTQF